MLLYLDGFDHYADGEQASAASWPPGWAAPANITIHAPGRSGAGQYATVRDWNDCALWEAGDLTDPPAYFFFFGFACRLDDLGQFIAAAALRKTDETGALTDCSFQLGWYAASDGSLQIMRMNQTGGRTGPVLAATAAGSLAAGEWRYVEGKFSLSAAAGVYGARVGGLAAHRAALGAGNTLGADAPSGILGASNWLTLRFAPGVSLDDFYCGSQKSPGEAPYDWLGDRQIQTLVPVGDGSVMQWASMDGGPHYEQIAMLAPDDATPLTVALTDDDLLSFPAPTRDMFRFPRLRAQSTRCSSWRAARLC